MLSVIASASMACAQPTRPVDPVYDSRKREANENVVSILGGVGTVSSWTRLVQDIQNVLDEPKNPTGLRILAVLGRGGPHNALDVLLVKGVDMAVIDQEDLRTARKDDPKVFTNAGKYLHYIAKLANSDLQIIAKENIKSISDLEGKKISCLKKVSSTQLTCETIFNTLGIHVEFAYLDQDEATTKLRSGEIAAFARYGPAPHEAFASFRADAGYHFVPIDPDTVSPESFAELIKIYSPAVIKDETYPQLMAPGTTVPTVAGNLILVVYAWPAGSERYQRVSKFVNSMFDNIDKFKSASRHPSWKEINLASDVPGWTRFKAAQDWLTRHHNKKN
jgi:TRAP-type uncharacterized transport system substrate-binding protein